MRTTEQDIIAKVRIPKDGEIVGYVVIAICDDNAGNLWACDRRVYIKRKDDNMRQRLAWRSLRREVKRAMMRATRTDFLPVRKEVRLALFWQRFCRWVRGLYTIERRAA